MMRRRMLRQVAVIAVFLVSPFAMAAEVLHSRFHERYRYSLEEGNEAVCKHMTNVFNARFKKPWDRGHADNRPDATVFGIRYDEMFERLPGVEFDPRLTTQMLLSKFPTSEEFERLRWVEGRITNRDTSRLSPVLIAHWVPRSGGKELWILKKTFMDKMTTSEGWGQANGGFDTLHFVDSHSLELTMPLSGELLSHPAGQHGQSRGLSYIYDTETPVQLRPFIFRDQLFIAGYQQVWNGPETPGGQSPRLYPEEEFMNILRLLPGTIPGKFVDQAPTEEVCRIRMRMQPTKTRKGAK